MLTRYKNFLYYGLLAIALVSFVSVRLGKNKTHREADYVAIANTFHKWEQGASNEVLSNLQQIVKKHPELAAQYDVQVGQQLLTLGLTDQARPYVESALKRTSQSYYSQYGHTSVTVSEGHYSQALEEALALKKQLLADEKEQSALFAFNLMRIAVLYGELADTKGELSAWKELKQYGGYEAGTIKDGFQQLLTHFTVQESSLLDYIAAREEVLSK